MEFVKYLKSIINVMNENRDKEEMLIITWKIEKSLVEHKITVQKSGVGREKPNNNKNLKLMVNKNDCAHFLNIQHYAPPYFFALDD